MALADNRERICLGGFPANDCFAQGVIIPILSLLQDIILEFSNEQTTTHDVSNLIDKAFSLCKVGAEGLGDAYQVTRQFRNTYALFRTG